MLCADRDFWRRCFAAKGAGNGASRMKGTAGRFARRVRRLSRKAWRMHSANAPLARYRSDERAGIGMSRTLEESGGGCLFDNPAQIHDRHVIGDMSDDPQVVRDEHTRKAFVLLKLPDELDYLCLHRNIERRYGFVKDNKTRLGDKGARDNDPLALSPGKLKGKPVAKLPVQADPFHQGKGLLLGILAISQAMDEQRFSNLPFD